MDLWGQVMAQLDPALLVSRWLESSNPWPHFVAIGKAALGMSEPLWSSCRSGMVICPHSLRQPPVPVELVLSSHPQMTELSLEAGRRLLGFLDSCEGPCLVLLSGGASALVEVLKSGVDPQEHRQAWIQTYRQGLGIEELNAWRSRFSRIKAGGMLEFLKASSHTLIWSDVLSGPQWVGSGLTWGGASTLLADGHLWRDQLAGRLKAQGWKVRICPDLVSEISEAVQEVRSWEPAPGEICLASAEVRLSVNGPGRGGRCQELALRLLEWLELSPYRGLLAASSDGEDGPTAAAGAWIEPATAALARRAGVALTDYLERQDSFGFFVDLGQSWQPGPTGNNLNDVVLLVG